MLIGTVCGLLGAYLARFTIKFMTNRTACIVFALISAGSLAVIMFFGESLAIYVVFNSLYQALTAAFQALLVPLYSETCTFAEWKTGADNSGVIMGMQQLGVKLGAIFKGVAVSISLSAAGYVAGMEATPALKAGILRDISSFREPPSSSAAWRCFCSINLRRPEWKKCRKRSRQENSLLLLRPS